MTDTISQPEIREVSRIVVRFAGDSGDGMQLTGERFTSASALFGNDLATLPEFPAEIRAPQGTLAGVSAFQVQVSDHDITTPGDAPNVLVAMNPAALKKELSKLEDAGTIIVNRDTFEERNLKKAGYEENPLETGELSGYTLFEVPMTSLTKEVCKEIEGIKPRDAERSKNFFALGLVSWLYQRPLEPTLDWIEKKFGKTPPVVAANNAAFKAGHAYGETTEAFDYTYEVKPASLGSGEYTNINGNTALSWGLVAAGKLSQRPIFLGSYPITPASDILHELAKHKNFGVQTFQAEDEIAAVASAIGASFGGDLALTTTSGPGVALKGEAIGLAFNLELPLVIIDIQRGGPSTGLPTKTEASDLLMAMYGRHGESPIPVIAPYSPGHCFYVAIEACRLALKYRTPVMLLSDGYLANGSEPWKLPDVDSLPDITTTFTTETNHVDEDGNSHFWPYKRDPETLARAWAIPGTPELMHRIGGIEKEDGTGNISYDPSNHQKMTDIRQAKVDNIANDMPPTWVEGDLDADVLLIGWGSTWGAIASAVKQVRSEGHKVAHAHLIHINPFPRDLGEVLSQFKTVICPEMNMGQLSRLLRAEYLVDIESLNKVQGQPFTTAELHERILEALGKK
ncbi:MAG: 2-oxoacid:acceptor oxidoreductase subunit alpha [Actinomycetota bacterium]